VGRKVDEIVERKVDESEGAYHTRLLKLTDKQLQKHLKVGELWSMYSCTGIAITDLSRYPLVVLQLAEVGLLQLSDSAHDYSDKYGAIQSHDLFSHLCLCCSTSDVLVWHHVFKRSKTRTGTTRTNGGADSKDVCISVVRLCPNCHARVHQANPFTFDRRPGLFSVRLATFLLELRLDLLDVKCERYSALSG